MLISVRAPRPSGSSRSRRPPRRFRAEGSSPARARARRPRVPRRRCGAGRDGPRPRAARVAEACTRRGSAGCPYRRLPPPRPRARDRDRRAQEAFGDALDPPLQRRQPALRPELQQRGGETPAHRAQAREQGEQPDRRLVRRAQAGEVRPERIGCDSRWLRLGEKGREPGVKVAVERGSGKRSSRGGRRTSSSVRSARATRSSTMPRRCRKRRRWPARRAPAAASRARLAADAAEEDGERATDALELDRGRREARPAGGLADQPVPEPADLLLVLQELERQGRRSAEAGADQLAQALLDVGVVRERLDHAGLQRGGRVEAGGSGSPCRRAAWSRPTRGRPP